MFEFTLSSKLSWSRTHSKIYIHTLQTRTIDLWIIILKVNKLINLFENDCNATAELSKRVPTWHAFNRANDRTHFRLVLTTELETNIKMERQLKLSIKTKERAWEPAVGLMLLFNPRPSRFSFLKIEVTPWKHNQEKYVSLAAIYLLIQDFCLWKVIADGNSDWDVTNIGHRKLIDSTEINRKPKINTTTNNVCKRMISVIRLHQIEYLV